MSMSGPYEKRSPRLTLVDSESYINSEAAEEIGDGGASRFNEENGR